MRTKAGICVFCPSDQDWRAVISRESVAHLVQNDVRSCGAVCRAKRSQWRRMSPERTLREPKNMNLKNITIKNN